MFCRYILLPRIPRRWHSIVSIPIELWSDWDRLVIGIQDLICLCVTVNAVRLVRSKEAEAISSGQKGAHLTILCHRG
jgi:hypothetical protein